MSGAIALAFLAVPPLHGGTLSGQESGAVHEGVTFTRDVAPILQQNCQMCHRPGSVGPMSLLTYEDVRLYAARIRNRVIEREMPPFHLDPHVGIQKIKNDWRLSEEEIAKVVAWVDAGTPEGDPAEMPPPVRWPEGQRWQMEEMMGRPPDHVIRSKAFDVLSEGGDTWWRPRVATGLDGDRFIQAMETRPSFPGGRQVVHHAIPRLLEKKKAEGDHPDDHGQDEWVRTQTFSEYAMGKVGELLPRDAGRLLPADGMIEWDIHYYPMGYEVPDDQVEFGVWFYPEDYKPEFTQDLKLYPLQGDIALAPGGTAMTQGFHRWDHPVRIDSWQAHGHVHLRGFSMEAIHPDGKREFLGMVTDFNARWHHSYIFEDDASPLLPEGTVLVLTAWYENTADNPLNPDPEVWYSRGARTVDEMSHGWLAVTHLSKEGYQRIKAEREAKARVVSDENGPSGP